jgi:hypothetical protein
MPNLRRLRKMRQRQGTQSICLTAHTGKVLHLLHNAPSPLRLREALPEPEE